MHSPRSAGTADRPRSRHRVERIWTTARLRSATPMPSDGSGDGVRQPVHVQVGTAPGHPGGRDGSGDPPDAPMPARLREEENEDHRRRARVGGVTRGVGRAVRLDHRSRGPLPADDQLDQVHEQRRQRLGEDECEQRGATVPDQEHEADAGGRERAQDAVADGVEDERDVGEEGCLDVVHQPRPPLVEPERSVGDQEREHARRAAIRPDAYRAVSRGWAKVSSPLVSPSHRLT